MLAAIRAGVTGDLAVITEPSNLDVVVAHAGAITFRLTVPGRAAHASQRREGISALDNLWALARALEADETRRNAAETDPLMTALGLPYPTIIGIVRGRRVGVDGDRSDRGRRTLRRAARARRRSDAEEELRACVEAACAERSVPARPPGHGRDRRRAVRLGARAVGPPVAGRPRAGRRAGHRSPSRAARRAVRRRHAAARQRGPRRRR